MKRYFILLYFYFLGIDASSYLEYLKANETFRQLAEMIESLDRINKKNIKEKKYDEAAVTNIVENLDKEYYEKLEKEIEKEFEIHTKISFDDKRIENCYLRGVSKDSDFTSFSVSSDNHTSLNFFTNVLDQDRHVYLGDTIDKQRFFTDKETLEKLSFLLIFTHITKGLYENIIQKGKKAIYCAGNHDIGWCFNFGGAIRKGYYNKLVYFCKKALRLTNFVECIVKVEDHFLEFRHGFGKDLFKKDGVVLFRGEDGKDDRKIVFVEIDKDLSLQHVDIQGYIQEIKSDERKVAGGKDYGKTFDIHSLWGERPQVENIEKEKKRLGVFKKITFANDKDFFGQGDFYHTYFFGHFHGGGVQSFETYFKKTNYDSLCPLQKKITDKLGYVFMPPSFHDNTFNGAIKLVNNIFPSYKFELLKEEKLKSPQSSQLVIVPLPPFREEENGLKEEKSKSSKSPEIVPLSPFCGKENKYQKKK